MAAVRDIIRRCRHGRAVKGTHPIELQFAFRHFGYDMTLVADLNSNPPKLATWARERMDMQAAYVVVVTDHWVAVWRFAAIGSATAGPAAYRSKSRTRPIDASECVLSIW